MNESDILRAIQTQVSGPDIRLFRNNVGQAWQGASHQFNSHEVIEVQPGDVIIRNGKPVKYGLCAGSSDLIGLQSIAVTPEMAGRTLAVFVACEVKSKAGRVSEDQARFITMVKQLGGIAGVARSTQEASDLLRAPG